MSMTIQELSDNMELVLAKLNVNDAATVGGLPPSDIPKPSTVVARDTQSDASFRTIRTAYQSQSVIPQGSSMGFRVNNTDDDYLRFGSREAVLDWLGRVLDSEKFAGRTLSEVREQLRFGLVPNSFTINRHRLDANFSLDASDVGLGNVPNFAAVSGLNGQSTSLLATQKAAYDASFAPNLGAERKRRVTSGSVSPSAPGEDGEVFIQY